MQFLCYRHIIEKIGSGTFIAQIVRRLLFLPKIENYQSELIQAISDINELIKNQEISTKKIKQISNIFNLAIKDNFLQIPLVCDHENGIWKRQKFGVSTCSNHIESLHKTLNVISYNLSNIHRRFDGVIKKILNIYTDFPQKSRIQAYKLLNRLRHKAAQDNIKQVITCNCGWGEIYSNRFGIPNFPCLHTILGFNYELQNLSLPPNQNSKMSNIQIFSAIKDWNFSYQNAKIDLLSSFYKNEFDNILNGKSTFPENFLVQTA